MKTTFKKATFFSTLVGLGFLLGAISGTISGAIASGMNPDHDMQEPSKIKEFRRIEQPFTNHIIVTVGGLGLIGLDIWWFLLSKPK